MLVRQITQAGDWTFGAGLSNYAYNNQAVEQNIATRLRSFVGDCFFDLGSGIDYNNLLCQTDATPLALAIASVILNTQYVTAMQQLSLAVNPKTRALTVNYEVVTQFSTISSFTIINPPNLP